MVALPGELAVGVCTCNLLSSKFARCSAQALIYDTTAGDEVEDLLALLTYAKQQMPQLEAVSCGAIASDYQRLRVEQVRLTYCKALRSDVVQMSVLFRHPLDQAIVWYVQSGTAAVTIRT